MSAIHEHELNNGMKLLCWHQPHLHGVEFGLYLKGGSVYETGDTQGVCRLLKQLCFTGLGGLNDEAMQRTLNRMGAELTAEVTPAALMFRLKALPRFFDSMVDLFARFMSYTPWTPHQIGRARQLTLLELDQAESGFDEAAARSWHAGPEGAASAQEAAACVASMEEDVIRNWQCLVFQPHNACLVITGNFSDGMERTAMEVFGELRNYTNEPPFEQPMPQGFCMRDHESDVLMPCAVRSAQVHLAFDVDGETVYPLAAQLLNAITAGSSDSILHQSLCVENAMVPAITSTLQELGQFSRLVIRYSVGHDRLADSLRRVFTCLRRLAMYVRPIRLNHLRPRFTVNNALITDDATALNDLAGWAWVAGDISRADLDAQSSQFADLTAEELLDAAQTVFRAENLCMTIQYDPQAHDVDMAALLREMRASL